MGLLTVFVLAVCLCFDSFAVSLTNGMVQCDNRRQKYLFFALTLALFQGVMPLIGWGMAAGLEEHIQRFDHWIAFALLALLGIKMIRESLSANGETEDVHFEPKRVCLLGIATSIDALLTGVAFAVVSLSIVPISSQFTNILVACAIIGGVTFIACLVGLKLGRSAGKKIGKWTEIVGGIVLILIGVKVLVEHLLTDGALT